MFLDYQFEGLLDNGHVGKVESQHSCKKAMFTQKQSAALKSTLNIWGELRWFLSVTQAECSRRREYRKAESTQEC